MYEQTPISYRWILFVSLVCFTFAVVQISIRYRINTAGRVVFCDVGQGDGVYIRAASGIDIVIDSGPDSSMLRCLGRNMSLFDKTIEYAFLSHPHIDHYGGFLAVAHNYRIKQLYVSSGKSFTKSYAQLASTLQKQGTLVRFVTAPYRIEVDSETKFDLLWPPEDLTSNDLNEHSQVFLLYFSQMRLLFTGDVTPFVLSLLQESDAYVIQNVDVLKVPHHGSHNGLTYEFLKLADPTASVISVGLHNRFNHPSKKVLDYFKALKKKLYLTAERGDITITTDGYELRVVGKGGLIEHLLLRR